MTLKGPVFLIAVMALNDPVSPMWGVRTEDPKPLAAPATDDEIIALIRDLGNPSYQTRTYATRRLCAIGMPAHERLQAAVKSGNAEVALRAEAVLAVLDRLMFSGVDVRLSFSKTKIAWDEQVDLTVTMTNRTRYPARVPFELGRAPRSGTAGGAQQVKDMLDIAELLRVHGPGGREIALTVDDIAGDSEVLGAVQERLNGGPSGVIEPGETVTIAAREFNRGWARYPLLDAGRYTVDMEYVPDWDDDVLASQRVGRVAADRVTLTVTGGAPPSVSRRGVEASLSIVRKGKSVAAMLTNRTDLPVTVNKNFGPAPPFADGRWICEVDDRRRDVPVGRKPGASWEEFDPALLVEVNAGESIELARIGIDGLRQVLTDGGANLNGKSAERWTVHFSYMNLCNRQWQVRQGPALLGNPKAPAIFRTQLPRRILSFKHTSNRLAFPVKEAG